MQQKKQLEIQVPQSNCFLLIIKLFIYSPIVLPKYQKSIRKNLLEICVRLTHLQARDNLNSNCSVYAHDISQGPIVQEHIVQGANPHI